MRTTWIVAADASRARVFEITDPERHLRAVEEFAHPEGRANNRELNSDAQGRYFSQGGGPRAHSATRQVSAVDHENELFSKNLSRYLDKARSQHRYDKLYLIAPPEFLGLMRENLSKEVRKIIAEEINKDLSWFDARDIERYVKPYTRPAWTRGNGNGSAVRKERPVRAAAMRAPSAKPARRGTRRAARAS
jgi:protein required for attachment to host cells